MGLIKEIKFWVSLTLESIGLLVLIVAIIVAIIVVCGILISLF